MELTLDLWYVTSAIENNIYSILGATNVQASGSFNYAKEIFSATAEKNERWNSIRSWKWGKNLLSVVMHNSIISSPPPTIGSIT